MYHITLPHYSLQNISTVSYKKHTIIICGSIFIYKFWIQGLSYCNIYIKLSICCLSFIYRVIIGVPLCCLATVPANGKDGASCQVLIIIAATLK